MKNPMKSLTLVLLFSLVSTASLAHGADLGAIRDLLAKYETTDMNRNCEVVLSADGVLSIKGNLVWGQEQRSSFEQNLAYVVSPSVDLLIAEDSDYDGVTKVYFIQREDHLVVIGTRSSLDEADSQSFCELEPR